MRIRHSASGFSAINRTIPWPGSTRRSCIERNVGCGIRSRFSSSECSAPAGLMWIALGGYVVRRLGVAQAWSPAAGRHRAPLEYLDTPDVMARIRTRHTLNLQVIPRSGYSRSFRLRESADANGATAIPPYAVPYRGHHTDPRVYLPRRRRAVPYRRSSSGTSRRSGSADLARALGLRLTSRWSIDGPRAGSRRVGPAIRSGLDLVEQAINEPAPEVSYLSLCIRGACAADAARRPLACSVQYVSHRPILALAWSGLEGWAVHLSTSMEVDDRVKRRGRSGRGRRLGKNHRYEGAWLYHGLYYYTRDGLRSGVDLLEHGADVCTESNDADLPRFTSIRLAYAPTPAPGRV